jgi:hypothetical protein
MNLDRPRSTAEIRRSLSETRRHLEADLDELEDRVENVYSPRRLMARHPAIMTIAGAALGVLLFRNPKIVTGALTRIAQLGAPFLIRAFLARDGANKQIESPEA